MATLSAQILTTLLSWYPVRNPIRVSVKDTTAVTGSGVRGAVLYTFGSVPPDGSIWAIDYDDPIADVAISFVNSVANADTQVDVSGSPAVDDWVRDTLVPFMQGLFQFTEYFDVSYDPATPASVIITNRSASSRNADPVNAGSVESGFTLDAITEIAGEDLVIDANTNYVVKLYVEDDSVVNNLDADTDYFAEVANDTFSPSPRVGGSVQLDLSEWLFAYVEHNQPSPTAATCVALIGATRRFRFTMGRRYYVPYDPETETGDYYTYGRMDVSEVATVVAAGRGHEDILTNPDWKNMLTRTVDGADIFRFLTNWPNLSRQTAKVITPGQVEYLCFIAPDDIDADFYELTVHIEYTDGSQSGAQVLADFSADLKGGRVYCIPFGVDLRDLWSIEPTKVPHIIRVAVEHPLDDHTRDPDSESRWFRVDYNYHEHHRQLHYFNSLCGIDTLLLTGDASASLDPDIDLSGRTVLAADTTLASQRIELPRFNGFSEVYRVAGRMLNRAEIIAARELYFSDNIVERDAQGIVRPVVLTANKAPSLEEAERFRGLPVQYRYNLNLQGTSPQIEEVPLPS